MDDYTKKEITIVFLSTYIGYWDLQIQVGLPKMKVKQKSGVFHRLVFRSQGQLQ